MSSNIKLKFRSSLPYELRDALQDFGFQVYSVKQGDWLIYEKIPQENTDWETGLQYRLDRIVDCYLDPYSNLEGIKRQVEGLMKSLPEEQRQFCAQWLKDIESAPPWEQELYTNHIGTC